MEQKMLLPVVIVVLVGGLLIGYYFGRTGTQGVPVPTSKGAMASIEASGLFVDPTSSFVTRAGFFEDLQGTVKSADSSGWMLSSNSRELALPARSVFFRLVPAPQGSAAAKAAGDKTLSYYAPMSLAEVKAGDKFRATVRYDAKTGEVIGVIATKIE